MTLVFGHGLFQGLGHLRNLAPKGGRKFIVLDLLGYGEHSQIAAPTSLDAQVAHVTAELDRHQVQRVTLVGHSVGGAIVMVTAVRRASRVAAVVNVEGNFTLADAFWSSKVAAMIAPEVERMLSGFRADPATWLSNQKIDPSPQRINWTKQMFDAQPSSSVHALAKAVIEATEQTQYLKTIEGVFDAGIPVHLFAGEQSNSGWVVPDSFVRRAASFTTQPGVGHMMPIEDPEGFLKLILGLPS
jgi:pimeloyl-ACP methyl ester carboxylesterase